MLVLTRKVGEKVYIGENIVVTVVASARGGVRLGLEAPTSVSIQREEIRHRGLPYQSPSPSGRHHSCLPGDELVDEPPVLPSELCPSAHMAEEQVSWRVHAPCLNP